MPTPIVLILKAELFAATALSQQVLSLHPEAECVIVHRVDEARAILAEGRVVLFLTGIGLPDGDVLDLLLACTDQPCTGRATLVITRHRETRLLASLRSMGVGGVFDATTEPLGKIADVVQILQAGGSYWSRSLHLRLLEPQTRALLGQMTPTEQLALALMGDGCADKVGAERLGMTLSATRALRRDIHGKLGAHDRADLIRLAVQHGFVRFTSDGAVPVGLGVLRREYLAHCKRPMDFFRKSSQSPFPFPVPAISGTPDAAPDNEPLRRFVRAGHSAA